MVLSSDSTEETLVSSNAGGENRSAGLTEKCQFVSIPPLTKLSAEAHK